MRVRCIRQPGPVPNRALTLGSDYVVLAVTARPKSRVTFRLLENRIPGKPFQTPAYWDSSLFEVVSNTIPTNWRVGLREPGTIELAPEAWLYEGFWADLFDEGEQQSRALAAYESELAIILQEDEVQWRRE